MASASRIASVIREVELFHSQHRKGDVRMKRGLKLTLLLGLSAMPFLSGIAHAAAGEDVLRPGEKLTIGQSLVSADKHAVLVLQADGNLVEYVYSGGGWWAFWHTGTYGKAVTAAVMQGDGNFVLYGYSGALWASNTWEPWLVSSVAERCESG